MKNNKLLAAVLAAVNAALIAVLALVISSRINPPKPERANEPESAAIQSAAPAETESEPPVGKPALATVKKFLETAMEPVGSTMYVYGGGWNEADTGAGEYAVTIGTADEWREFYSMQDSSYNSSEHRYEITKGLDCSGYLGWVVYNTLETESGKDGYVFLAQEYADRLAEMGFGEKTDKQFVTDRLPGDIMSSSSDSHVWISLGQCSDGSVVLVNSSPPGVRICGTVTPDGDADSEAVRIAEHFMSECFPDWYAKFDNCLKGASYLTNYDRFRWYTDGRGVMSDPDKYIQLTPEEILTDIFFG